MIDTLCERFASQPNKIVNFNLQMNEDTIEHLLGLFNMVESKRSPEMLPDVAYPFYNQEPTEIKETTEN